MGDGLSAGQSLKFIQLLSQCDKSKISQQKADFTKKSNDVPSGTFKATRKVAFFCPGLPKAWEDGCKYSRLPH